jgi:nitrogen regulatory protein P-II 2
MKMIVAIVQPDALNKIKKLLYATGVTRFVVDDCWGHSDEEHTMESYRGVAMEVDLKRKIRIQVAVNDNFVEKTVQAMREGGRTGKIGDGKIFVYPIEQCYRISNDDEGTTAIGGYNPEVNQ